ncbi:MAG: hypothetical protein IPP71_02470 [Bacteroidetes bacterium]|nr:hypothetical protein [Bacteroidota bacterium]
MLIFRTDVAFSQWQIINSGVTDNLVDGCFISDSTGFIIGSNGTILKTTDSGNSWSVNAIVSGLFTSICHVGLDTLYVGGNCIYRSDNGGISWNLITTLPDTITDLGFFDSQTGFSIVPDYNICTSFGGTYEYDDFKVFKTTNFGSSWQLDFDKIESNSRFQFINDSTAYVTGGEISIVFHCLGPWQNRSKRTNDSGNTWFPVAQANFGHSYFSFINENIGYFVLPGPVFTIDKTVDGGNTLTQYYTEIYDNTIKQCKFFNEIDGYLLGRNNIYVTGSNGLSWNSDFVTANTFNILFSNTTNLLFGVGSNGLIIKRKLFQAHILILFIESNLIMIP